MLLDTFLTLMPLEIWHILTTMCLNVNRRECTWPAISTVLLKLKDFSRSQAVMYTVKVVIPQKWCKIETF